jgi:hypothetical protein
MDQPNMTKLSEKEALRQLGGTPAQIAAELHSYAKAAQVLSSDHPRLIDEHPLQWVGVYQGRVAASGATLQSLMSQLEKDHIPAEKTIVRFIDKEERTLIL